MLHETFCLLRTFHHHPDRGRCPPLIRRIIQKLNKPPLAERWFGIYVDNERVGFYRQNITETADGYQMEGDGSVRMNVMGFSKEASSRETYLVGKNLALRSFEVDQTISGTLSRLKGQVYDGTIRIKSESNGKTMEKNIRFKGDIIPGPALNLYPMMRDIVPASPRES